MSWKVVIGQTGADPQERVSNITVTESLGMVDFSVTITAPTLAERNHFKGRRDAAIIQISRGSEVVAEGFIEDVEYGSGYVKYTGRSFLILLGYSTSSETSDQGETQAEYEDDDGQDIINDLILRYCIERDSEIVRNIVFPDKYGGTVKLHGKKVYQIVKEMCQMYGYDLWSTTTWVDDDITEKIINVGMRERGNITTPHMTLYGGRHFRDIPIVRNRSSQAVNCLRVIGGGTGKDKVSEFVEDETDPPDNSIENYGHIEGEPYHNNMIRSVETARAVGAAIINAKKDPIEQIRTDLIVYIANLQYGDWVRVVDTHTKLDVIRRIKKITRTYDNESIDRMYIELGTAFDDYQNIINDLTKGDVEPEPDMTYAGGSLRITANDPPSDYVRVDGGSWYGTDGILHRHKLVGTTLTNDLCAFWQNMSSTPGPPPWNPSSANMYCRALVQIRDDPDLPVGFFRINYKTNLTSAAHTGYLKDYAMGVNDDIIADKNFTPVGEVILKGLGGGTVDKVDAIDEDHSFIFRDARPILGATGKANCIEGSDCLDDKNPFVCVSMEETPCRVDVVAGVGGTIIFRRLI